MILHSSPSLQGLPDLAALPIMFGRLLIQRQRQRPLTHPHLLSLRGRPHPRTGPRGLLHCRQGPLGLRLLLLHLVKEHLSLHPDKLIFREAEQVLRDPTLAKVPVGRAVRNVKFCSPLL